MLSIVANPGTNACVSSLYRLGSYALRLLMTQCPTGCCILSYNVSLYPPELPSVFIMAVYLYVSALELEDPCLFPPLLVLYLITKQMLSKSEYRLRGSQQAVQFLSSSILSGWSCVLSTRDVLLRVDM
jgi:hypothetical protein